MKYKLAILESRDLNILKNFLDEIGRATEFTDVEVSFSGANAEYLQKIFEMCHAENLRARIYTTSNMREAVFDAKYVINCGMAYYMNAYYANKKEIVEYGHSEDLSYISEFMTAQMIIPEELNLCECIRDLSHRDAVLFNCFWPNELVTLSCNKCGHVRTYGLLGAEESLNTDSAQHCDYVQCLRIIEKIESGRSCGEYVADTSCDAVDNDESAGENNKDFLELTEMQELAIEAAVSGNDALLLKSILLGSSSLLNKNEVRNIIDRMFITHEQKLSQYYGAIISAKQRANEEVFQRLIEIFDKFEDENDAECGAKHSRIRAHYGETDVVSSFMLEGKSKQSKEETSESYGISIADRSYILMKIRAFLNKSTKSIGIYIATRRKSSIAQIVKRVIPYKCRALLWRLLAKMLKR